MEYQDFEKLINDLIDGSKDGKLDWENKPINLSVDSFDSSVLEDFKNQKGDFWKYILKYMKEKSPNLISQKELNDPDDSLGGGASVFGYINEKSDIDRYINNFWEQLISNYYQADQLDKNTDTGKIPNDKNYYWNESVSKAISYFLLNFDLNIMKEKEKEDAEKLKVKDLNKYMNGTYDLDPDEKGGIVFENGIKVNNNGIKNFHVSDIVNADAGVSFNGAPWVRPQYNVDGDSYKKVRGIDKIQSVLNSTKELQFTNKGELDNNWIRLLMPKYLRYVEVEDLNRNFWVIGQTIAAISAYLFGDGAPFNEALKNILNEIAQLWQNIMYLWATTAILNQNESFSTIHREILVLPNNNLQHYVKFDGFGKFDGVNWDLIKEKIEYLVDSYSKQNLIIIPCIRNLNYKHNFYAEEIYPGAALYDRNVDQWKFIDFRANNELIRISIEPYKDRIYGINEEEEIYNYYYPFSNTPISLTNKIYYGLLDTIVSVDGNYSNQQLNITNFRISIKDRAFEIIQGCLNNPDTKTIATYYYTGKEENGIINLTYEINAPAATAINYINESSVQITKGFYQGELISNWSKVKSINYSIRMDSIDVLPVLYLNKEKQDGTYVFSKGNMQYYWEKISYKLDTKINDFIDYLENKASIYALQLIYDIENGYYENNEKYSHSGIVNYLKNAWLIEFSDNISLLNEDFVKRIFENWFLPQLDSLIESNFQFEFSLDEVEMNQQKLVLSAILLAFLSCKNTGSIETENNYYEQPYIEAEINEITINEYDEAALRIYGVDYTKKFNSDSLNGYSVLLDTRRSDYDSNNPISERAAILITNEEGKIICEKEDLVDLDKLEAKVYLLFGQQPKGDLHKQALMIFPSVLTEFNEVLYPLYQHSYLNNSSYNGQKLISAGLGYGEIKKNNETDTGFFYKAASQSIQELDQTIYLTEGGAELTFDNWAITMVRVNYHSHLRLYWDSKNQERTYAEKFTMIPTIFYDAPAIGEELHINKFTDYETTKNLIDQQNKLLQDYNSKNEVWIGKINQKDYYIDAAFSMQVSVCVFTHDGHYAQKDYIRVIDMNDERYMQWIEKENSEKNSGISFANIRNGYKAVYNDMPGYDWERYKSDGKEIKSGYNGNEDLLFDDTTVPPFVMDGDVRDYGQVIK